MTIELSWLKEKKTLEKGAGRFLGITNVAKKVRDGAKREVKEETGLEVKIE